MSKNTLSRYVLPLREGETIDLSPYEYHTSETVDNTHRTVRSDVVKFNFFNGAKVEILVQVQEEAWEWPIPEGSEEE